MNEGYGVRGARAYEADRKERNDRRKRTARRVAKTVGSAAVTVGSAFLTDQIFNQGQGTRAVEDFARRSVNVGKNVVRQLSKNKIRF